MKVIDDFIKQYNKEFDFYLKLSQLIATKIEDQLFKRGLKAIVTFRAKRPDRLKDKLLQRVDEKQYKTVDDIYQDIVDLAGIRVSLYFPSERDVIDEIVAELFVIEKKKVFPDKDHKPKYDKRFSGYWANHYRVKLREESTTKRYSGTVAEIQVASVLMHAWAEVEHDLVYKPFAGKLSKEEQAILDEINGLVLSGEIALERLQSAMAERTGQRNDITDRYELINYLISTLSKEQKEKIKLGNTSLLTNYLKTIKKLDTDDFKKYIDKINLDSDESATDQLLNMLLVEFYDAEKPNLKNYFKNLHIPDRKASGFESFVKCWVVLEKAVREYSLDNDVDTRKYFVPDFKILETKKILTGDEVGQLRQLRQVRNYLLHGIETPPEDYLRDSFDVLKKITEKVVGRISDKQIRDRLKKELDKILA